MQTPHYERISSVLRRRNGRGPTVLRKSPLIYEVFWVNGRLVGKVPAVARSWRESEPQAQKEEAGVHEHRLAWGKRFGAEAAAGFERDAARFGGQKDNEKDCVQAGGGCSRSANLK